MTLSNENTKLFDRQIRIFGINTQEKLINTSFQLITQNNPNNENSLIGGEILKNLLLLGVADISASKECVFALEKLVPKSFMEEKKVNITNNLKEVDIHIFIDCNSEVKGIFICSKCYMFNITHAHQCIKECDGNEVALDCLLGSIFVQEMVKKLMGVDFCTYYKLIV